jgi:hypothetical protein
MFISQTMQQKDPTLTLRFGPQIWVLKCIYFTQGMFKNPKNWLPKHVDIWNPAYTVLLVLMYLYLIYTVLLVLMYLYLI